MIIITGNIQSIVEGTRSHHQKFEEEIQPYTNELWKYCRYVTGSPWEGEDLYQETLLKAFAMLPQMWRPVNTKAYLFRIATNGWIDECRKRKENFYEDEPAEVEASDADHFEIKDALEYLVGNLTPKQVSTILLMDVFQFKANEVANMIHMTENAVHATLHRARKKLRSIHAEDTTTENSPLAFNDTKVVDRYLEAFNNRDIDTMVNLMSDTIHMEVTPGFQEFSKEDVKKGSSQAGIMGKKIFREYLWGKWVLIVLAETSEGLALHDVQYQDVANDKIVRHKSYFFCRQLLTEIAEKINVPLQLDKPPVNWNTN
ncbi:RNA polymerase sigma factor [Alkalihalobacillus sp. AL-G]|uniref:RNA polymerase sigma factor n=1 Tax=Alkalihalobacillus sp. AL-G TaxID=2926399 RepID=UPI00272B3F8F|nr:RNA polymerase sigma factor [Alkalihalobacillus sp. AL-G]WLD94249.1 sigma-70 family RNA polymerase sigma factor [Alkalihalobacillus sp. AL-G]